MSVKKDKIFADGFYIEKKEGSPDWVIASLSIKVAQAIAFLQANEKNSGYVNLDIKESVGGSLYCELNTWTPKETDHDKNRNDLPSEEVYTPAQGPVPIEDGIDYPEDTNEEIPF